MEEKIKDDLDAYTFQTTRVCRGRGAFICDTDQGMKIVKAYHRSPQRLEIEQLVKYTIRDRGYYFVDQLLPNKEWQYLNNNKDGQMYTVYETLSNLGVKDKAIITAFNKQDKLEDAPLIRDFKADYTVKISAKTGAGLTDLTDTIEAVLREQKVFLECMYEYRDAAKIQLIRKYGELLEEKYQEDGIFVRAYAPAELYSRVTV